MTRTHRDVGTWWPSVLALCAVWLFACFFLLGNLGYWNDDYFICSRDPATGEPFRFVMDRMTPFEPAGDPVLTWRPLYNITLGGITALFWDMPCVMHLIGALTHLATTFALWWLLRLLGRTPQAAFLGAAVFCCYPVAFEAIFWTCAIPTALSACCYILATCFFVIWSGGPTKRRTATAIATVCFAALVPCFNEQAAAGVAAWPFLYLACRPPSERWARSAMRLSGMLAIVGIFYAGYIAMVVASKRGDGGLGAAGQLLPMREWPHNFLRMSPAIEDMLKWSFLGTAAMKTGIEALREMPLRAAGMIAGILATFAIGWRAWTTAFDEPGPVAARNELSAKLHARRLAVVGFALTLGCITLLPLVVVTDTAVRPRMAYIIIVAMAVLLTMGADVMLSLARRANGHKTASVWLGLALLAAIAVCSLSLIGTQRAYHLRQRLDDRITTQLRELIPDPGSGAVLLALDAPELPVRTGHHAFDTYFIGPWYFSWGYQSIAQHVYRRTDIDSGYFSYTSPTIVNADTTGMRFFGPMLATFKSDTWPNQPASEPLVPGRKDFSPWIAWERVVPFIISPKGDVRIVTELLIDQVSKQSLTIRPARTQGHPELRWQLKLP